MTNVDRIHSVIKGQVGGRAVGKTHAHLENFLGQIIVSNFWEESPDYFFYVGMSRGDVEHTMKMFFDLINQKNIPATRKFKYRMTVLGSKVEFATLAEFQTGQPPIAGRRCYVETDFDFVCYNEIDNIRAIKSLYCGAVEWIQDELLHIRRSYWPKNSQRGKQEGWYE